MMRHSKLLFAVLLASSYMCSQNSPQTTTAGAPTKQKTLEENVLTIREAIKSNNVINLEPWTKPAIYASDAATKLAMAKTSSRIEEERIDKQTAAPNATSSSSSTTSKGGVPWLLGFALEHGGLTQSTSGNVATFRGNVANTVKALTKKN